MHTQTHPHPHHHSHPNSGPHLHTPPSPGSLAADLIRSSPFDLMVFDQHLEDEAGLQGTDLARLARTCGSKAIIAGFSANPMREEHLAAGCDLSWDKVSR